MADMVIKLSRRYEAHGKGFDAVSLRAPKLRDYLAIGEPVELHPGPDGQGRFVVTHEDRIATYLDRLTIAGEPGRECLDDLDLVDAIAVKDAITGFFTSAHERLKNPTS